MCWKKISYTIKGGIIGGVIGILGSAFLAYNQGLTYCANLIEPEICTAYRLNLTIILPLIILLITGMIVGYIIKKVKKNKK